MWPPPPTLPRLSLWNVVRLHPSKYSIPPLGALLRPIFKPPGGPHFGCQPGGCLTPSEGRSSASFSKLTSVCGGYCARGGSWLAVWRSLDTIEGGGRSPAVVPLQSSPFVAAGHGSRGGGLPPSGTARWARRRISTSPPSHWAKRTTSPRLP